MTFDSGDALLTAHASPSWIDHGRPKHEVPASHVAMVSHPDAVVELIEQAAEAASPSDG
jgi:hypothetical protein